MKLGKTDPASDWYVHHRLLAQGLSNFLNAYYQTRAGKMLFPFVDQHDPEPWRQWTKELLDSKPVTGQYGQEPGQLPRTYDVKSIAQALSQAFAWAYENYPDNQANSDFDTIHCLRGFSPAVYQGFGDIARPIIGLSKYAQRNTVDKVLGLYLHGSFSTLDFVPGSSDLDTVVIVTKETLLSPESLLDLRGHLLHMLRWFFQIDYSQHHGYFVLSDLDLAFFDDAWFPSVLFPMSTVLLGPGEISVRKRRVRSDPAIPFRHMCDRIRDVAIGKIVLNGWFELKLHLQGILLLPTLYLQARHHPVYKRDSFALVRSDVEPEAWEIIEKASRIRSLGVQGPLISSYLDRQIATWGSPWMLSIIHRTLRNSVPAVVWEVLGDNWQQQSLILVDTLVERLRLDGFIT